MGDTSTEFFEALAERGREPALAKTKGTVRFDLADGDRTTRWLVAIDDGDVAVSHRNAKADCVVRVDKRVFDALAAGRQNAMAALLRGAIDARGDLALLLPFQRLFPPPPRRAR